MCRFYLISILLIVIVSKINAVDYTDFEKIITKMKIKEDAKNGKNITKLEYKIKEDGKYGNNEKNITKLDNKMKEDGKNITKRDNKIQEDEKHGKNGKNITKLDCRIKEDGENEKNITKQEYKIKEDGKAPFAIPFIVSVQGKNGNSYGHLCAGTIIDESWVLTAAHCFHKTKKPEHIGIIGGSNQFSNDGKHHSVQKIILHERYSPFDGYDIALLKLSNKLRLDGKRFDKVNFRAPKFVGKKRLGYLIGWGRKRPPGQNLEAISFTTIDSKLCRKRGFIYVSCTEVCAVNFKSRGACDGDSGGPLMSNDFKQQLAILSYGKTPCQRYAIYAFTRLSPFVDWIEQHLK